MKRELLLTVSLSMILIVLTCALDIPAVHAGYAEGKVKTKQDFRNHGVKTGISGTGQAAIKDTYIDNALYYFLITGEKKSFLIEEKTYFLIYKRKTAPSLTQEELRNRFIGDLDIISEHGLSKLIKFRIKKGKKEKDIVSSLYKADTSIHFISPALTTKDRGGELAVEPTIIVSLDKNTDHDYAMAELTRRGLSLQSKRPFTDTEYRMKIDGDIEDISIIFETARAVAGLPFIQWTEPDFVISSKRHFSPDDPLFDSQWHLHNTGQNGAAVDADVDAPEGWDVSRGLNAVIAIYDGGIDLAHDDLNIWSNPGETGGGKETNGIDDDGNGYVDDYQGWDFNEDDNDPSPIDEPGRFGFKDNHGTAVAGVAGAIGNNSLGVTGSAQGAEILPVSMNSGSCSDFADAMRYAGKHADVVNNSWSIDACESNLNSAISDVVNGTITGARRGTKGTPVLFASGNDASGWVKFTLTGFPSGTYTFRWRYSKDAITSSGYDTVWVDGINWPGGGNTDFESETVGTIPTGFTSGGHAAWTVVSDGVHARGASGKSAKAGLITHSEETYLDITRAVGAGDLTFWAWISSEQNYDFFDFYVDGTRYFHYTPGQYGHSNDVGFPASNTDTIAVGASNDGGISGLEERSDYSQFGSVLDVVAPSSGGGQGITTTDRSGNDGYDNSDYTSSFGGTSSATPLVAGIAADIIAHNPSLTAVEVRTILRQGADKVGPYAYSGGRNDFYGYGRVNLFGSLCPDSDGDGYTVCANDCDDGDPTINPAASEVCDNKDNDCDGTIDGMTRASSCGVGECSATGTETCTAGTWGGDTCTPGSPGPELCDNLDNDCDGTIDSITRPTSCGTGACTGNAGEETCTAGVWGGDTCDPLEGAMTETCNAIDDDCDGETDEGLQYLLTTSVNPPDNGSISGDDCSAGCLYDCQQEVLFNAVEDSGYPFTSWTGCDFPSGSLCTMTMDADTSVTAGFDTCRYPVRVVGTSTNYYSILQSAYDDPATNDTDMFQYRETTLVGDMTADRNIAVTIQAGFDCNYSNPSGTTTVDGNVTVTDGIIILESGTLVLQ